jgi:hypothetical protein
MASLTGLIIDGRYGGCNPSLDRSSTAGEGDHRHLSDGGHVERDEIETSFAQEQIARVLERVLERERHARGEPVDVRQYLRRKYAGLDDRGAR